MKNKLNWIEQDKLFGLDYSTAKSQAGDYSFDIRYDYCGDMNKKPQGFLVLDIRYQRMHQGVKFASTVGTLKKYAENWLKTEIKRYSEIHNKYK